MNDLNSLHDKYQGKDIIIVGSSPRVSDLTFAKTDKTILLVNVDTSTGKTYDRMGDERALEFTPDISIAEGDLSFSGLNSRCVLSSGSDRFNSKLEKEYKEVYAFQKGSISFVEAYSRASSATWKNSLNALITGKVDKRSSQHPVAFDGLASALSVSMWLKAKNIYLVGFEGREEVAQRSSCWHTSITPPRGSSYKTAEAQIKLLYLFKKMANASGVNVYCGSDYSKFLKVLGYSKY